MWVLEKKRITKVMNDSSSWDQCLHEISWHIIQQLLNYLTCRLTETDYAAIAVEKYCIIHIWRSCNHLRRVKCNLKFHCNHLRRQPQFLPLRNKLPLIGPPHILPDVFIFFFYLPHLIDMLLPVFLSVCVCASVSLCTWCFVLGPINTEHSFLSALCPRQNNNRMLSKEKPSSLFSPHWNSCHHFLPLSSGLTVSTEFECLEEYQAGKSHSSRLASLRGLLLGFHFSSTALVLFSSLGLRCRKRVIFCWNNIEIQ